MHFAPDDVWNRLHESPFQPFRIVTTSGDGFDVHHPELVMVGEFYLQVGLPREGQELPIFAKTTRLALAHVTELRD